MTEVNMTGYKMIVGNRVYNVLQIMITAELEDEKSETPTVTFIDAIYIDEDGSIKIIWGEAWRFQFVRAVQKDD